MNKLSPLAEELNEVLDNSRIGALLSQTGRALFFPKGIVAQAAEAKAKAHRFNATAGIARRDQVPMTTKALRKLLPSLEPAESVSYAPTGGIPALRKTWKELIQRKNPSLEGTPFSLPVVTSGITHGISVAMTLFLDPGDRLIVPDMRWGNYDLIAGAQRNAVISSFPFFSPQLRVNTEALRKTLRGVKEKAVLVWNFPNNPTGYTPSPEEADEILSVLGEAADRGTSLLVLCDDAYFGLYYEANTMKESLFARLANFHEAVTTVKLDGVTKEEFAWGLRVGFLSAGGKGLKEEHFAAFEKKCLGAIRSSVSNVSNLSQHVMLRVLHDASYEGEKQQFFQILKQRYEKTKEVLSKLSSPVLKALPFNSGYFMTFQCPRGSAEKLRLAMLEEGIGIIAIRDEYIRVTFASVDRDNIEPLLEDIFRIAEAVCTAG